MALTLFDATVAGYIRTVDSIASILKKGREYYEGNGLDLTTVSEEKLIGDMLPFHFQINSVMHHSVGAIEGVKAGQFGVSTPLAATDYASLEKGIAETADKLRAYTADEINKLGGKDVVFVFGETRIPFTTEGFLMSFSIPNFHFHAATTYDILRMKGVPLGKRDYLGALQVNMG